MSDALSRYLLNEEDRHAPVSAEMLELMGKKAASSYLDSQIPLNQSIAKLAAEHPDFNTEQVKRVCEFANTSVYLGIHEKNKTAGAAASAPSFEIADPFKIVQDLANGSRPNITPTTDIDYNRPPPSKAKTASVDSDRLLAEAFGVVGQEKVAHYSAETGHKELMDTKDQLVSMKEHLARTNETFHFKLAEAAEEYYSSIKQHLLDGNSFADVVVAARSVLDDKEKIAEEMKPIVERLLKEKVAKHTSLRSSLQGMSKVAHRVVNHEHPLVSIFGAVVGLREEKAKCATALVEIDKNLEKVNKAIGETLRASTSR